MNVFREAVKQDGKKFMVEAMVWIPEQETWVNSYVKIINNWAMTAENHKLIHNKQFIELFDKKRVILKTLKGVEYCILHDRFKEIS